MSITREQLFREYKNYPGGDLIIEGLLDLDNEVISVSSFLVLIAAPELRRIGIDVVEPKTESSLKSLSYEHKLYEMLCKEDEETAYTKNNALISRISSFFNSVSVVL